MPTKVARTEGGISVERLTTHKNENYNQPGCNDCSDYRWRSCQESGEIEDCIQRLTWIRLLAIEDILGDEYDLDELRGMIQAKREGRVKIEQKARRCPRCGKMTLFPRIDWQFYYCYSCKTQFSKSDFEAALRREQDG